MSSTEALIQPSDTSATGKVWQIDPTHTGVEFAVKHLMISTVKGHFTDVTGTVTTNGKPEGSRVAVELAVASIDTRQPQRDEHLRSPDFFDAANSPKITFVSTSIRTVAEGEFRMTGDLTIRGVTRSIELEVTAEGSGRDPWGNDRAGFSARGKIDRRDFGLTYNQALETGGVVVGNEVKVTVDVELTHTPA